MRIEDLIKELSKKYNKKEKVIQLMFVKSQKVGYDIEEFKEMIKKFYCY